MSKIVNASAIGKLIEAHLDGDNEKFMAYATFIEESYRDNNDEFAARLIHSRLDGSYKTNDNVVALDKENNDNTLIVDEFDRLGPSLLCRCIDEKKNVSTTEENIDCKSLYYKLISKIKEVANEHKYKVQGDRESYSEYNEGWQDAVDAISSALSKEDTPKTVCSYTVADALVMTEYCGKILDFCGNEIKVTEENKDEVYGLLVNQICASGNNVLICTFLNEDKWLAKEEQKKKTLKELAEEFDGREYAWEQFTSEEINHLKELGVVVLYGASDDLCEIDGAVEGEVDCYIGGSERVEFTLCKDGPVPFGKGSNNLNKVSIAQENGCWKYHISGLVNYAKFMIKEDGEDYCEAMLFYAKDLQ